VPIVPLSRLMVPCVLLASLPCARGALASGAGDTSMVTLAETPSLSLTATSRYGFGTLLLPVNFPKPYIAVTATVQIPAGASSASPLVLRLTLPSGALMGTPVGAPAGWTCSWPNLGQTGAVTCGSDGPPVAGTPAVFTFNTGGSPLPPTTFGASLSVDGPGGALLSETSAVPILGDPVLLGIGPATGSPAGGYLATLTADSLPSGSRVSIGNVPVDVTATDNARLTFQVPAGVPGSVDVRVTTPQGATLVLAGAFTYIGGPADVDADGLADDWERRFGLRVESASDQSEGAGLGDPDGDGVTNRGEQAAGTHPRGAHTRYFAEGAIKDRMDPLQGVTALFDTRFSLLNPGHTPAAALMRFLRGDGVTAAHFVVVPAQTRVTVDARSVPSLPNVSIIGAGLSSYDAEFATVVESDVALVVDRTMRWDHTGYGAHAETSLASPSTTWYLAEGATHSGFDLFYLLQNVAATAASVQVEYLLPAPAAPVAKQYTVPAHSRFTIWVDEDDPRLRSTDVSARITSDRPLIVERAMYLSIGRAFDAGHNSGGVTAPRTRWFFAEGATGTYFDLFVLVANPGVTPADVKATYLLPSGETLVKTYTIAPHSRFNIWVDLEDALLADTAVSTVLESTNGVPIIAERSMWWPGNSPAGWHEAHNSPGATETGTRWALAEGEVGGAAGNETYILVANTSSFAGQVRATLMFEDGATSARTFTVAPNSRFNVSVAAEFPEAAGRRFGAVIDSLGTPAASIVVERAMYWNAGGVKWAAGTNALATRLQ
jgi:hypothetical protein